MSKEKITVKEAIEDIKDTEFEYTLNNKIVLIGFDKEFETEKEALKYLFDNDNAFNYEIFKNLKDDDFVIEIYSDDDLEEFLGYEIA
jgi:hypothetical protein